MIVDLLWGNYQVKINRVCTEKNFHTKIWDVSVWIYVFQFKNPGTTFQRVMDNIFANVKKDNWYVDNAGIRLSAI